MQKRMPDDGSWRPAHAQPTTPPSLRQVGICWAQPRHARQLPITGQLRRYLSNSCLIAARARY